MTIETLTLIGLGAILFASILAQSLHTDLTAGFAYSFSSRDATAPGAGVLGPRLARNVRNQVEGLALYLPFALAASELEVSNAWTEGAAAVYLAARTLHPLAYGFGLNPLRTLVWSAGFCALPAFAWGLLAAA
jgi:uncharacterized MAPEG superfamily protein